jgi:hypothetical protein
MTNARTYEVGPIAAAFTSLPEMMYGNMPGKKFVDFVNMIILYIEK